MELNNKSHQHLKLSSCSASSSTSSSEKGCPHDQLVAQDNYDTCVNCGVYVPKSGVKIYKSAKMNYQAFFPSKTIYETLVRRSTPFRTSVNPEYVQIRQSYVEWILELADKLRISNNSSHLAVLLLDTIMFKDSTLTPKLQLYAPVCLLLASKTIELDERIPFIPKLRRYANPSFSIDDYRRAELKILDIVDWNPQYSTAIEITEFLMCQGVLFSTDEVEHHVTHSERAKLSPEALRENTQHENTHHVEVKSEDKKETAKDLEKLASPNSKENNENSYSEASTTGTNNDNLIILPPVAEEEPSPINVVSPFLKHNSTPKTPAETHQSLVKVGVPVEKKLNEILTHFETSYTKLATLLVKDAEFIEYEPKTLAASIIAFLRYINKISPIWNSDFEIITCLKFSQISTCFELIHKKYNTAFNMNTPKLQNVYYSPNSNARDLQSEIKFNKSVSCNEKTNSSQKVESFNKASVVSSIYSRPAAALANISDLQNSDSKQNERKPIFSYQKQNTMPLSNVSTSKYLNGTVNTEVPQRAPAKGQIFTNNLPQKSSFSSNQDFLTAYYSGNTSASSNSTAGSISASGSTSTAFDYISSLVGENLGRGDSFNSKSSLLSNRSNSSMENSAAYQTKIGVLKK